MYIIIIIIIVFIIIIIIIKIGRQCKAECYVHSISPKTPTPQYQPIEKKKETRKNSIRL